MRRRTNGSSWRSSFQPEEVADIDAETELLVREPVRALIDPEHHACLERVGFVEKESRGAGEHRFAACIKHVETEMTRHPRLLGNGLHEKAQVGLGIVHP